MDDQKRLNNRYQLEELVGSGGMAVVYRASDLMLERPVAVKILRQNFTYNEEFRERFRQEARAAANLSHPNIVTIYDYGISEGHPFMVMEYVPGQHLKRLIQQRSRMLVGESINLISQACAGIGYAHRAGVIHCDIKPLNFVVSPDQVLKVTDFGIARALSSIHPDEQAEIVWGSPQYFAPEQAAGGAPSPASDVYSLGVVLYEMLTGQLPFQADTSEELAILHQTADPMLPSILNPSIPPALDEIILKLLAKDPADRFRTADQLGYQLTTISEPQGQLPTNEIIQREAIPIHSTSAIEPEKLETQLNVNLKYNQINGEEDTPSEQTVNPFELDWATILLGLLALILVGGLVPFWLWVLFKFNVGIP